MSDGVSVTRSGAYFSTDVESGMTRTTEEWTENLAKLGAADIRATQNTTFRTQTPYARLQTEAVPEAPGWKIWDKGLVYGPWLEGTGSRNKTSRFKGYRIWRSAVSRINARAVSIGQPIIARWLGRMN